MNNKNWKKAHHVVFINDIVLYKKKIYLGSTEYKIVFSNGEITTISEKRFKELYIHIDK